MKIRILRFTLLFFSSLTCYQAMAVLVGPTNYIPPPGCCGLVGNSPTFHRTYKHQDVKTLKKSRVIGADQKPPSQSILITKADFQAHLAVGKTRPVKAIPYPTNIPMDVKGIDVNGTSAQTWNMPNFNNYTLESVDIQQVTPQSTGYLNDFPGTTHSFYNPLLNVYEMMELTNDDLFAFGAVEFDQNNDPEFVDAFLTLSPVPMDWGLLYEGIVTVEYSDDPDYDSTVYHQYYDVVAFGTLNTYDDGPKEGLKLLFTEKVFEYKDGQVIEEYTYDEIIWYCKDGHYLRGRLAEGAPKEGPTTFEYMEYQKVTDASSATHEQPFGQAIRQFPNPVSAGQVLTVQLPGAAESGSVEVMNMLGMVVSTLSLNTVGNENEFKVQIPANFPSGMYTYRIFGQQGESLGFGKIQVQ